MELAKLVDTIQNMTKEELELLVQAGMVAEEMRKPTKVEISAEEKAKMDEVMDRFREYIDGHYYFDIFYSKKYGFIKLVKDGHIKQLDTADGLLACLIDETANDVRELKLAGEHMTTKLHPLEEEELRKRIFPLIDKLTDKEHYFEWYEAYTEKYKADPDAKFV